MFQLSDDEWNTILRALANSLEHYKKINHADKPTEELFMKLLKQLGYIND